jgi:hypothetical protein
VRKLREEEDELDIEKIALPEGVVIGGAANSWAVATGETTAPDRSGLPKRESKRLRLYRLFSGELISDRLVLR